MDDVYNEVCNFIPLDLWRIMFCYMSIPSLCRFEVVCQEWKKMIQSSDFGKLWAKNHLEDKNMLVFGYNSLQTISMFDFSNRQRYEINCLFFKTNLSTYIKYRFLATDNGLVLILCRPRYMIFADSILVCNPITKTYKYLSLPKTQIDWKTEGGLIVNLCTSTYKIITFENESFDYLHIYDSSNDKWKTHISIFNEIHVTSWSIYENTMYFLCKGGLNPMLMAFDINKETWIKYNLDKYFERGWKLFIVKYHLYFIEIQQNALLVLKLIPSLDGQDPSIKLMYRNGLSKGFHDIQDAMIFGDKIIIPTWNEGSIVDLLQQTIQSLNNNLFDILGFDFRSAFKFSLLKI